ISSLVSTRSLVMFSAEISVKPRALSESISPGYTVIPVTSMTCAFLGIATEPLAPNALILPADITKTPFSITPCETVRSLPPLRTRIFCCPNAEADRRQNAARRRTRPTTNDQRPTTDLDDRRLLTDD